MAGINGKGGKIAEASRFGRRIAFLSFFLMLSGCTHARTRIAKKNDTLTSLRLECEAIRRAVDVERSSVGRLVKIASDANDYGSRQIACHCLKTAYPSNAGTNVSDEEIAEISGRCMTVQAVTGKSFETIKKLLIRLDNFVDELMTSEAEHLAFRKILTYIILAVVAGFAVRGIFRTRIF